MSKSAALLCTGSELLSGRILNTNAHYIARCLHEHGIKVKEIITCGDERGEIAQCFSLLIPRYDIVIATGGLGPTFDDVTRDGLADATGRELVQNIEALNMVRRFIGRRKGASLERNIIQAQLPAGAEPIDNPSGSAPGIFLESDGCQVFCLPGIPQEMMEMLCGPVLARIGQVSGVCSGALHLCGLREAEINERLKKVKETREVELAMNADGGIISILFSAGNEDSILKAETALREEFGNVVFGSGKDTLASVIGEIAVERGCTIGAVESCTGGLVGRLLTDIAGSSRYFSGTVVCYADAVKRKLGVSSATLEEFGAVSAETAGELSRAGRVWLNVDFAVSVTGIAGPSGGTAGKPVGLVYISVSSKAQTNVFKYNFGGNRGLNRRFAAIFALNELRRAMLEDGNA